MTDGTRHDPASRDAPNRAPRQAGLADRPGVFMLAVPLYFIIAMPIAVLVHFASSLIVRQSVQLGPAKTAALAVALVFAVLGPFALAPQAATNQSAPALDDFTVYDPATSSDVVARLLAGDESPLGGR